MSKSLAIELASLSQRQSSYNPAFEELLERIKQRAFELYEARGCVDGNHEEDWANAERKSANRVSSARSPSHQEMSDAPDFGSKGSVHRLWEFGRGQR